MPSTIAIGITAKIRKKVLSRLSSPVRILHRVGQRIALVHALSLVVTPEGRNVRGAADRTVRRDDSGVNHRIAWLDVFAERPLAGNGLAVVDDADEIDDETMLAFAREMDLSETTFVQSPEADGADYRNRIFTVATRAPVRRAIPHSAPRSRSRAGAAWRRRASCRRRGRGCSRSRCAPRARRWRAEMVQNQPEFGTEIDVEAVMHAVGLNPAEAHQDLAPQVVSTGLPTAIVPVSERRLARASEAGLRGDRRGARGRRAPSRRDAELLPRLGRPEAGGGAGAHVRDRACPGGEDPATGSAAGPLGAYLAERAGPRARS